MSTSIRRGLLLFVSLLLCCSILSSCGYYSAGDERKAFNYIMYYFATGHYVKSKTAADSFLEDFPESYYVPAVRRVLDESSAKCDVDSIDTSEAISLFHSVFDSALNAFETDNGRLPTATEGLDALCNNPGLKEWQGPYLPYCDMIIQHIVVHGDMFSGDG